MLFLSLVSLAVYCSGSPSFAVRSSSFSSTNKAVVYDVVSFVSSVGETTLQHSTTTREFLDEEITFDGISTYGNGTLYYVNDISSTVIFRVSVSATGTTLLPALDMYAKAVNHLQFLSSGQLGIVSLQETQNNQQAFFYTEYPGLSGSTRPVELTALDRVGAVTLVEGDSLYLVNVVPGQKSSVNTPTVHIIDVATGKETNATLKCNFPSTGETVITAIYGSAAKGHATLHGMAATLGGNSLSYHAVVVSASEGSCTATPLSDAAGMILGTTYDRAAQTMYGVGSKSFFSYDFGAAKFTLGGAADKIEDVSLIQ